MTRAKRHLRGATLDVWLNERSKDDWCALMGAMRLFESISLYGAEVVPTPLRDLLIAAGSEPSPFPPDTE